MSVQPKSVHDVQGEMVEIAGELLRNEKRLQDLSSSLSYAPDHIYMGEELCPADLAYDLSGILGGVQDDMIGEAINLLRRGSAMTDEDLRRDFRNRERLRKAGKLSAVLDPVDTDGRQDG